MPKQYQIKEKEVAELQEARKANRNKKVERRIKSLLMRAEGKSYEEIGKVCEYHPSYVSQLVSIYCNKGISAIIENHYPGNRRNISEEEEAELLSGYKQQAEQGQMIEVHEIRIAYEAKVGHSIGNSQIYRVLKRHGWRKVMPRSKHPNKASDEAIEASKKLRPQYWEPFAN